MKEHSWSLYITLLSIALFFWLTGECRAGRMELCLDSGPRGFSHWWEHLAHPNQTFGIAVKFAPEVYPCVVRSASVLVDSADEFSVHIMDEGGVDMAAPATASAIEPLSFAVAEFPEAITIDSGQFYVLAETFSVAPAIATARYQAGTLVETYLWRSDQGFYTSYRSAAAIIRVMVDQPVRVSWTEGHGTDASNQHLFLTFDSEMDGSTINSDNIVLDPDVVGTWRYDDQLMRAELMPDSPFPPIGRFYHIDVSRNVGDVYGNHLVEPWSSSFVVKSDVDEEPPPAPLSVSVTGSDTAIEVSWGGSVAPDTLGYYVYTATSVAGEDLDAWLGGAEKLDVGNVLSTRLENLANDVVHGVAVSSYDFCRNEGQAEYRNCVPHRGAVLAVVEEKSPDTNREAVDELVAVLESVTFDYTIHEESKLGALPQPDYLLQFGSVFWERGIRMWAYEFEPTCLLQEYMQGGGGLYYNAWLVVGRENCDDTFFSDWLHMEYRDWGTARYNVIGAHDDPIGHGLDLVYTSDVSFAAQIAWFEPKDGAVGFLHVKDSLDEICGLHYQEPGECASRLVFSTAPLCYVYDAIEKDKLMSRALCWLQGKELDFRIASNTRVLEPYSLLQLFVAANSLTVEADVDAYLAVMVEPAGGSGLLFYDGSGFVSGMRPFVSGAHVAAGLFLPRTKVFEYLVRDELPSGKYTFFVALAEAGTQTLLTEPRSTTVFVK